MLQIGHLATIQIDGDAPLGAVRLPAVQQLSHLADLRHVLLKALATQIAFRACTGHANQTHV